MVSSLFVRLSTIDACSFGRLYNRGFPSDTWIDVSHSSEHDEVSASMHGSRERKVCLLLGAYVFIEVDGITSAPTVQKRFDEADTPVDVSRLDIEYTEDRRYFKWKENGFPDPV